MATNTPYSFTDSLKNLASPFTNLFKSAGTKTTPTYPFMTPQKSPFANLGGPIYPQTTPQLPQTPIMTPLPTKPSATASFSTPVIPQIKASTPATPMVTPSGAKITPPATQISPATPQIPQDSAPGGVSAPTTPVLSPEAQSALKLATDAYQKSLQISPDELSTQGDLDKLVESTKKAYEGISGQAIPMEFITGQLKSVEQRALNLAEPLERKLARLQASRQSSMEASKFALDRAEKSVASERESAKPISGTSFYDPRTGKFIQAPSTTGAAESFTLSPGQVRYDASGNVIASGGPRELSEAEKTKAIEKEEKATASQQQSGQTLNIINSLLTGDRYKKISGIVQTASIPFVGDRAAVSEYKQLKAQLALGARSLLKGSGAVSDYESKILQESTSALSRLTNEPQMKQALENVAGVLKTNSGLPTSVVVTNPKTKESITVELSGKEIYDLISEGNLVTYQ